MQLYTGYQPPELISTWANKAAIINMPTFTSKIMRVQYLFLKNTDHVEWGNQLIYNVCRIILVNRDISSQLCVSTVALPVELGGNVFDSLCGDQSGWSNIASYHCHLGHSGKNSQLELHHQHLYYLIIFISSQIA